MKIDEVVEIINSQPAEEVAAHYALPYSSAHGHLDEDALEGFLLYLKDAGAVFDLNKAYARAIDLFKQWSTE